VGIHGDLHVSQALVAQGDVFFIDSTAAPLGHHSICARSPRDLPKRMLLEKAAYEICHEADHRPALLNVPLHGLAQLLSHL
jgi:predicted trehalose synthase